MEKLKHKDNDKSKQDDQAKGNLQQSITECLHFEEEEGHGEQERNQAEEEQS